MVVSNGETKVAQYGQWDGYPSGAGTDILKFLRGEGNLETLRKRAGKLRFISPEELDKLLVRYGANPETGSIAYDDYGKFTKENPTLSRDTGADVLYYICASNDPIPLENSEEFAKNGLFCEWVYVVDLDKNQFEVYKGFNTSPPPKDQRFYDGDVPSHGDYFPVHLVDTFYMDVLPTEEEFLSRVDPADPED
jgi:hypothetical protein